MFYNDLITTQSWSFLQQLRHDFNFVLIGGWAVYLYTRGLKSKDIDIIVDYPELEKIRQRFSLSKNERLRKYEARYESTQIDIYLPHYSQIGIPTEDIVQNAVSREGFNLPQPEMLLILKQFVYQQRANSPKGEKDRLDILGLLTKTFIDWQGYLKILKQYQISHFSADLRDLIRTTIRVPELNLNEHHWSRLKKSLLSSLA